MDGGIFLLTLGLTIYIAVITLSFYLLRIGRIQRNLKLIKYGSVLLFSSVTIPPVLLTSQISLLIDIFISLVKDYPILHLLFWFVSFIIILMILHEFMKPLGDVFNRTPLNLICVCMALAASSFGYFFFVTFICTTSAALSALLLSVFLALLVFGAAAKI